MTTSGACAGRVRSRLPTSTSWWPAGATRSWPPPSDWPPTVRPRGPVLLDDRTGVSAGVKFNDADLIGIPTIVIVGGLGRGQGRGEGSPFRGPQHDPARRCRGHLRRSDRRPPHRHRLSTAPSPATADAVGVREALVAGREVGCDSLARAPETPPAGPPSDGARGTLSAPQPRPPCARRLRSPRQDRCTRRPGATPPRQPGAVPRDWNPPGTASRRRLVGRAGSPRRPKAARARSRARAWTTTRSAARFRSTPAGNRAAITP